ncbi:MAG: response regulator transcription factor [Deltaproteobacteria bacterium]|nr:response regulator transcription factor [Deltaproteobacteria bacterium]
MNILIAEDDATSRMMLRSVLTRLGYEVVEAVDGNAAWEVLKRPDAPRLVIVDWIMPGMDGLELVRRVRNLPEGADGPETGAKGRPYMIMLTSRDKKDDVIAGLDAGADDYLTKPFDPGELRARVAVGERMVAMEDGLAGKIRELHRALDHIRTLQGILPICASCKKIRDDNGYWEQVESYITKHSEVRFSHSVCPACAKKLYPEYYDDMFPEGEGSVEK